MLGALKRARLYVFNTALLLVARAKGWKGLRVPGTRELASRYLKEPPQKGSMVHALLGKRYPETGKELEDGTIAAQAINLIWAGTFRFYAAEFNWCLVE